MKIRPMIERDRAAVKDMMRVFYSSPAVHTDGSDEIFEKDIDACVGDCAYLEGYVFEENDTVMGYSMLAKGFSTEFGKPCIWIEDIYIKDEYRGRGIGKSVMDFIAERYGGEAVIRLEAEEENTPAVHLYEKSGFQRMPYLEMIKL